MTRTKSRNQTMARRVAIASMTVLVSSGVGLVAAPMAFGQIVLSSPLLGSSQGTQVTNAGSASANTGGNTAIGNGSTNTASATAPAGGLLNVPVSLGAPTNTSTGEATVTSGAATAVGNGADTTVGQSNASGNQVNGFLAGQQQGAGVVNAGSAGANTGGNTAIGNGSKNTATVTQNVGGGLLGVGVTLGGPTNNSTGTATVNSGAANAAGNSSETVIGQSATGGAGGGPGGGIGGPGALVRPGVGAIGGLGGSGVGPAPCNTGRFGSFQNVNVRNEGQARADTGNNVAIGNASTNNASTNVAGSGQTVSGGLLGVGLTIGGPVNNSSGTAVITTGPANAVGNDSVTTVGQVEGCPQVARLTGGTAGGPAGRPGIIVPAGQQLQRVGTATLARTGLDTGDLGMLAGAALGAGLLLVASQRRRMVAARSAAVPMAGFGLGLGDDWDRAVRR